MSLRVMTVRCAGGRLAIASLQPLDNFPSEKQILGSLVAPDWRRLLPTPVGRKSIGERRQYVVRVTKCRERYEPSVTGAPSPPAIQQYSVDPGSERRPSLERSQALQHAQPCFLNDFLCGAWSLTTVSASRMREPWSAPTRSLKDASSPARSRSISAFSTALPGCRMNADAIVPVEFATSLRNTLCPDVPTEVSGRWIKRAMWVAAAAVLAAVGAYGVQWVRTQRSPVTSQTTQIPAAVLQLTEHAAGDHRDCVLRHQLPEAPIDLAQAASHDRALKGLDEAIQIRPDSLPASLERRAAHICVWKGQRFGHLVFSYRGETVSLLVSTPEASVASFAAGAPAEWPTTAGFSIACFADSGRAVFVVSDLPSSETLMLANVLSGSVRDHLARALAALRAWVDRIS